MGDVGAGKKDGVVQEDNSVISNPDPSIFSNEIWAAAEKAAQEVINCIHPNLGSEEKRKDVVDYMQRLFKCTLGYEVVPFGSVPLKTYLPDGDIDLTVLSNPCVEDSWFTGVLSVLQGEERNENAEYEVKDTQFIDAEVKVVKCLVKNIVIDISFNQLGGISTLCFLEKVDRLVGKDHLFKRSIILIKSWCYYESRILASNHGLLSTYAVETLVLCIFQLFHSSLETPFAVLYRFLDYFSKFDWENYGISVNGPFRKSSVPDIVVEMPANHANNLLLDEEFFRDSIEMFTVPPKDTVSNSRVFQPKHLNIMDPLRDNNNLGRSVHRGNFYRIRSALKYGARKLGGIMSSPVEGFPDEIKKFFSSTLQRHLYKSMWDKKYILEGSKALLSNEGSPEDDIPVGSDICNNNNNNNGTSYDYAACDPLIGASDSSAPHYNNLSEQPSVDNGPLCETELSDGLERKLEINPCSEEREDHLDMADTYPSCLDNLDSQDRCNDPVSSPETTQESLSLELKERDTGRIVDTEPLNPLADLMGDYDSHIRSLSYFKCCHELVHSPPPMVPVTPALPPAPYPMMSAWEPFHQPFHYNRPSSYPFVNPSPAFIEPSFYAPEGNWNNQGTGLPPRPNFNPPNRDRPFFPGKASGPRAQLQVDTSFSNSYAPGFVESRSSGKAASPSEASKAPIPYQAYRKTGIIISQSSNPREEEGDALTGGNLTKPSSPIEFGSLGPLADDEVMISGSADSGGCLTAPPNRVVVQNKGKAKASSSAAAKEERHEDGVFYLREEEFPVLSVGK